MWGQDSETHREYIVLMLVGIETMHGAVFRMKVSRTPTSGNLGDSGLHGSGLEQLLLLDYE